MIDPTSPVSAIVAARNEEPTVGNVVKILVDSGWFREVLVVSDGSTDHTAMEARHAGATQVRALRINRGKGGALAHGVKRSTGSILFFCDADLHGLRPEHLDLLLKPVRSGRLAMCIGLRDRGRVITALSRWLPRIGGERALRREIFEAIPSHFLEGFMIETALNVYCKRHHLSFDVRRLAGLRIRRKMEKVGWWQGGKEYVRMSWQIVKAHGILANARWRREI